MWYTEFLKGFGRRRNEYYARRGHRNLPLPSNIYVTSLRMVGRRLEVEYSLVNKNEGNLTRQKFGELEDQAYNRVYYAGVQNVIDGQEIMQEIKPR